jgi:predicted aldo/keto reductase-like oxidoreductase
MMQYRQYGKDGPQVSALGFGAMRLPSRKKGDWRTVHFGKSVQVMRRAMEAGVNLLDSHHGYHEGLSEVAVGRALKGWKGRRIYVQTKTPFYNEEPMDYFKKLLDQALEKTGVNPIDYLLFHSMCMQSFKKRGRQFFKFTDWAIKRGLIRRRGFSAHDEPEKVKAFIDTGEFAVMLLSYNWMNPQLADVIAYGADKGMGVAIMNPVGGGSLAVSTPQILDLLPGAKSSPEVALRFVLSTPGVTLALSGMNTLDQVDENVAVASRPTPMTAGERRTMLARMERIKKKTMEICTSCGYCMPCPHGVDIPQNFLLFNRAHFFGLTDWGRARFNALRKHKHGDKSALACRGCAQCLKKCPNKVQIIRQLKETAELLSL